MNSQQTQAVYKQASDIRSIAEEMNRLSNGNLKNAADSVAAVWRGDAANVYLRHCEATRDLIRETTADLLNITGDLEHLAQQWDIMNSGGLTAGQSVGQAIK